ncbi:MAG: hypothetical protein ACTSWN_11135 [Promethearchaeota archaeon]
MSQERVFSEAEQILAEFPRFWAVDQNINHLYGVVEKTGVKEFTVEIIFPADFPHAPPKIKVSKEIKDLLGENINLRTLVNWNPDTSRVVSILKELKLRINQELEEDYLELRRTIPRKAERSFSYADSNVPEPFDFQENGTIKTIKRPAEIRLEGGIEVENNEVAEPAGNTPITDIPENRIWTADTTPQENLIDESYWSKQEDISSSDENIFSNSIEPEEMPVLTTGDPDRDARILQQLEMLQMEYQIDYKSFKDVKIYLPISLDTTFIIIVDLSNFPEKPLFKFPADLLSFLPDPDESIQHLHHWNPHVPAAIVEVIRELESKLWSLNDIEMELKKIFGEFNAEYLPGSKTAVKIMILTYGFKEYYVTLDLRDYPNPPTIEYGPNLANLIKINPGQLKVIQNWNKQQEKESVAILREINWLIDKESRMAFEIDLLKGSIKDVSYDPLAKIIKAKLKGMMKTQEETFEFQLILPENYPMNPPKVRLLSEIDDEIVEDKLNKSLSGLLDKWIPSSSYLIDIFNLISKSIFEVSVITCIICHKFNCPTCSAPLDTIDLNEKTCKVICPYCERPYHKHCWDQTIATFGKCGFCLRAPPPELYPH